MPKKQELPDFGKAFQELEETALWFEQGEPDLDKGLAKFERAMALAKHLKKRLLEAENRVKEIRLKEKEDV